MIDLDDTLVEEYLEQSCEHLATIETGLLAIEKAGAEIDEPLVNRIFRAAHWIAGGAGFLDLVKIRELARQMENVLALIRSRKMVPTPDRVCVLLRATDKLHELMQDPGTSNLADIAELMACLAGLSMGAPVNSRSGARLRVLLVEDDFASRLLLQTFLSRHGECHVAVNGQEAVDAFRSEWERGQRYDLICMDIMMPVMDGREAVRQIRALEEAQGIVSTYGTKIIMMTAVEDIKEVIRCFRELCDAYLMKPINLTQLLGHLRSYQLVR